MDSEERKQIFAALLKKMLDENKGVKGRLALKFKITPQRLTPWLQGKVDPGELGIETFAQIAIVKGCSVDELAKLLGLFHKTKEESLVKFRRLVQQMLEGISQEQLAQNLQISQNAISKWLDPKQEINPNNISAIRMAAIAQEKGWTIEKLLIYLGLEEPNFEGNLRFQLKSMATKLSLNEQIDLLASLFDLVQEKVEQREFSEQLKISKSNRKVLLLIEEDNIGIASRYTADLLLHLQLKPENITIATPLSMPECLSFFDVLLFDLNNQQSPCIPLIESLDFDGDVVAIVDRSLPQDIQDRLKEKVTEVIVKPVPWSQLKNKPYFLE